MGAPTVLASRELALAQARILARHGRYAEAEELLTEARDDAEPSVALLDLLARVHAQQGQLDEADRCWAEVERLVPDNKEATDGRRRIAGVRAGRRRSGTIVLRVAAGVVVVAALALLIDTRVAVGRRPEERTVSAAPTAGAPAARPSPADVLSQMDLRTPGVHVRRTPGEIAVTFDKGLFRDGVTLSPGGRAVLRALGARLRPYAMKISVDVIGETDQRAVPPGSGYAGNTELGTLRATVVREALRRQAGIPTARFSVSSLGGATRAGSAARSRTASLRISALEEG